MVNESQAKINADIARIKEEQRKASLAKYANKAIPISQAPTTREQAASQINQRNTSKSMSTPQNKEQLDSGQGMSMYVPEDQQSRLATDSQGNVIGVEDKVLKASYEVQPSTVESVRTAEATRYSEQLRQEQLRQAQKKAEAEYNRGTLKAATPQEQKALQQSKNPITRNVNTFTQAAKEGLTATGESLRTGNVFSDVPQEDKLAMIAGGYTGIVGNTFIRAGAIKGGLAVGGAAASGTEALFTAASNNAATAFLSNIVGASFAGITTFKSTQALEYEKQKLVLGLGKETPAERKAFEQGRLQERAVISKSGNNGVQNIVNSIGFEIGLNGNPLAFEQGARQSLIQQGIITDNTQQQALNRLQARRTATQEATFSGTLAIGAFSEQTGTLSVIDTLAKGAKPTFNTFGSRIAPAGAGEGFAQTIISQENVGDTRDFFSGKRNTNILGLASIPTTRGGEAFIGGAIGGAISGILGGGIGSTAFRGQKVRSGALETVGNILDPTEKPSDFLQEIITGRTSNVKVKIGTTVNTFTTTPVSTQSQTNTPSFIQTITGTPVNVNTNTPSLVDTEIARRGFTPVNINTIVGTPADTNTPVDIPVDIPADTNTPVDTNVPLDIFTNVPVNVFTDKINAPLPIPLPISLSGGSVKGVGRKSKTGYINELDFSRKIFNDAFGFSPTVRALPSNPKKTKKRAAARTPQPTRFNHSQTFRQMIGL